MQLRFAFFTILSCFIFLNTQAQNTSPFWSLAGNNGATASPTSKLGTTTSLPLNLVTNNVTRLRIFEDGRVGVGSRITSANATRVLNLADDNAVMRILRTHASFAPAVELISRTSADGPNIAYWDMYAEPGDKSFRIRDRVGGGSGLDRVTISSTGDVGIGTNIVTNRFVVTDNTTQGPTVLIQNLYGSNSFNDAMFIQAGNNIGIGSTYYIAFQRPDYSVIGSITQSSPTSVAYNTTSDKRLKTNVRDSRFGLAEVNKIQVMDYNFMGDKSEQTGFLAQQLFEVFPEAVTKGGDDPKQRPWMVDYGRLTPLLVKAVQELSKKTDEVEELKKENADIKQQFADLKRLVNKLAGSQNINTSLSSATLLQNAPNPVSGTTSIQYSLPEGSSRGQLLLTDALGKTIRAIQLTSSGVVNVDVSSLSSGVYNYSLVVDGNTLQTKKMTVIR